MAKRVPPPWMSWDPDLPVWEFVATNPFKKYGKCDRILLMHKVVEKCDDWVLVDTLSISAESRVQTLRSGKLRYTYSTMHQYNEQAIAERYSRSTSTDSNIFIGPIGTPGVRHTYHLKGIEKLDCIIRKESILPQVLEPSSASVLTIFTNKIKPVSLYSTWSNDPAEAASNWARVMHEKLEKQILGPKLRIAGTMQGIEDMITDSLTKSVIDML